MKYFYALKSLPQAMRPSARDSEIHSFSVELDNSERRRSEWLRLLQSPENLSETDILKWLGESQQSGDLDEAFWRAFLAVHFGRPSANAKKDKEIESAGQLLCGFGTTPVWTWCRISEDPATFRDWFLTHQDDLAQLRFGNHRKFEAKKAIKMSEVIDDFVKWVYQFGCTPCAAFVVEDSDTPERKFNALFNRLKVKRFGRTGRFDMLCLLGDMGLLPIKPGSCYLEGSTGPLHGAKNLWGELPPDHLTRLADEAARHIGISMEVFEDALCNWQKSGTDKKSKGTIPCTSFC